MLRKYISDIAFMQVINLLVKPIWILVIDRAVQNVLPQEVYGNYFALYNFSLMFFIILDLGLNSYNTTEISRDTQKIVSVAGHIIGLKLILMIVYVLAALGVGSILGYTHIEFQILLILCVLQIITSFNQYLRSIVASLQKFKWDGVFMVLDRIIIIGLCSVLIWGQLDQWSLTIHRFIYAQLIGVSVVLCLLILFLFNHLTEIKISFNLKKLMPIFYKSWPFALLITLMGLYNYVDSVMLKLLVGNEAAGSYALGYRLFYALLMFAQIFSGVLLPLFSKNIANISIIKEISTYTVKFLLLVALTAVFVSFSYSDEIIKMLYPMKYNAENSRTFSLLMIGFIGSVLILVYGTLLTAALELKYLNIAAFFTLLVNVILNTQLIPVYGPSGAAIATFISQLLFGSICFMISYRKFKLSWVWSDIWRLSSSVIFLFMSIVTLKQYMSSPFVHSLLILGIVGLVAYVFKLFHVKNIPT